MGCPKLTWSDYIRLVGPAQKTAYGRIFHKVTDDPIGNRIRYQDVSYAYNKLNQITSMSDAEQGSPFPFHYDNWGNLVKSPTKRFKYDLQNRLIEVKNGKVTVKYFYDPLGQRIKSEETTTKGSKATQFLMSGMVEQARLTKDGEMWHTMGLDLADSLKKTGGVGAYLASSCGQESDVYLYDGNGNVSSTVQDGVLKDRMVYSPFGKMESGKELAFGFSSKAVDESGLSYYGYRFYSSELERWLRRDPILEGGGENLYVLVRNSPISQFDLKGMANCWPEALCNTACIAAGGVSAAGCGTLCVAAGFVTNGVAAPWCVTTCATAIAAGTYGCSELCAQFAHCEDDDCEVDSTQDVADESVVVGCVSGECEATGTYYKEQVCVQVGTWPYYREIWQDTGNPGSPDYTCPAGYTLGYLDFGG